MMSNEYTNPSPPFPRFCLTSAAAATVMPPLTPTDGIEYVSSKSPREVPGVTGEQTRMGVDQQGWIVLQHEPKHTPQG